MLFSRYISAIATVVAIVAPTIPGCGVISSGLLKFGMIATTTFAAKTADHAVAGDSIKTPLFLVTADAIILGACTYMAVTGFLAGGWCAAIAIFLTLGTEAMFSQDGHFPVTIDSDYKVVS